MWKKTRSLAIGVATGLLGVVLLVSPIGLDFERDFGLSWLFWMRGPLPPPPQVAVVGINSSSGTLLNLAKLPRDWPRSVHGDLVEYLARADAAAVVYDFDFSRPKEAEDDARFAHALAEAGRVVLLQRLVGKKQPIFGAGGATTGWIWLEEATVPAEPIASAARAMGPFPLPKVDQAASQFWTFKESVGDAPTTASIAVQIMALPYYAEWREALIRAGAPGAGTLPGNAGEIIGPAGMRALMGGLRSAFLADPTLVDRVRSAIDDAAAEALPPEGKLLLRALAALYAGPGDRYLNFYGPPGTILTFPYEAVLPSSYRGPRPTDGQLAGRVVFAGYSDLYEPDQPDRYYTVFTGDDGIDLSGVEIMATAFANLATDRTLRQPDAVLMAAIVLAFGFVVGASIYTLPALVAVPMTLVLAVLYAAGAQWMFNADALWLPVATPGLVQIPFALITGLLGQYLLERKKVQSFADALEKYVPESVVRDLTGGGIGADAVNKVVFGTCLANDMSGFSTISENLSPRELARFMNAYFDAMAQPLKRNGVDVTEFHADTIMCAWTRAQDTPAGRRQVLVGAIGVLDAMARFNEKEGSKLSARIGIQDGNFYLGHTGGGGRMAYSILGDPANTASRLEGLNKHLGTQILAAQSVVEGIEGLLLRPVGSFQLVGKHDGLPAVQVMAMEEQATDAQRECCRLFARALQAFQARAWDEAAAEFAAVLAAYPEDGPSRMYAGILRQYAEVGLPEGDPTIIRMTSK